MPQSQAVSVRWGLVQGADSPVAVASDDGDLRGLCYRSAGHQIVSYNVASVDDDRLAGRADPASDDLAGAGIAQQRVHRVRRAVGGARSVRVSVVGLTWANRG